MQCNNIKFIYYPSGYIANILEEKNAFNFFSIGSRRGARFLLCTELIWIFFCAFSARVCSIIRWNFVKFIYLAFCVHFLWSIFICDTCLYRKLGDHSQFLVLSSIYTGVLLLLLLAYYYCCTTFMSLRAHCTAIVTIVAAGPLPRTVQLLPCT